jgi:hypothetical protein
MPDLTRATETAKRTVSSPSTATLGCEQSVQPQLNKPPARPSRNAPDPLEPLAGEQVSQGPGEQDLVESFPEDMRRKSRHVEIQIFRVPSAAEPCTEIEAAFDDPVGSVQSGFQHPNEAQMEAFDVLEGWCPWGSAQSARSATSGSTRVALQAGMRLAPTARPASRTTDPRNATASVGRIS